MRKVINLTTGEETLEDDAPLPQYSEAEINGMLVDTIKRQMAQLEASQFMTRGEREGWITLMVTTAQGKGVTEPQLYQANPFYKKLKDTDAAVSALRGQL